MPSLSPNYSGYGSYAIVYLVKEVLYDNAHELHDDTPFAHDEDMRPSEVVYGREFALKCLSKSNLTEEQMAVQKFEATLHRALPSHPNVVALHKVGCGCLPFPTCSRNTNHGKRR